MNTAATKTGGMRIRQRKKRTLPPIVTDIVGKYITISEALNQKLDGMKDSDYIKFRDFSTKLLDKLSNELKRAHFKKRDQFKVFKGDEDNQRITKLRYLIENLFYNETPVKLKLRLNNAAYLNKTYSEEGIRILINMVINLKKCVESKTYDPPDPAKEYNKKEFDENCKILGVCNKNKIPFSLIKDQYDVKKHEVKDDTEKSLLIGISHKVP